MNKTITTYLLSHDPRGAKKIWCPISVCQAVYLPRKEVLNNSSRDELKRPSLYFLFGDNKKVYIGESENFSNRIKDHDAEKDWWTNALSFSSSNNLLKKTDIQYLEYLSIKFLKKSNFYNIDDNKQIPNEPFLPENEKDTIKEFFEEIKLLCSFLNYSLFYEADTENNNVDKNIFYCKKNKTDIYATGIYSNNGMIVLEKSKISRESSEASYYDGVSRLNLLKENSRQEGDYFILTRNIEFTSPSTASAFCLGRSSNGWTDWKNGQGKTLDDVFRKNNN